MRAYFFLLSKMASGFAGTGQNFVSTSYGPMLYNNGFNSLEKLGSASVDDLLKIKGVNEKFIEDIKDQLKSEMDK